jgi:hypothetical protein
MGKRRRFARSQSSRLWVVLTILLGDANTWQIASRRRSKELARIPVESHVCGIIPEHCLLVGTHTPEHAAAVHA